MVWDKKRYKIRGLHHKAPPLVVRWLGAYGHASDLVEMAKWESAPDRQVAAEALDYQGISRIEQSRVGLLVDTQRTHLMRAYVGDAYTYVGKNGKLLANRQVAYVTQWGHVWWVIKKAAHQRWYVEATLDHPVYKAVVVKDQRPSTLKVAELVARIMDLPIWQIRPGKEVRK